MQAESVATGQYSALDRAALLDMFRQGVELASTLHRSILVSHTARVTSQDILPMFAAAEQLGEPVFFWENTAQHIAIVGAGEAYHIVTRDSDRFVATGEAWRALLNHAIIDGLDTVAGSGPTLLGGFAFDPLGPRTAAWHAFAAGSMLLPRLQLTTLNGTSAFTFNAVVDGGSDALHIVNELDQLYDALFADPALPSDSSGMPAESKLEDLLPATTWKTIVRTTVQDMQQGRYEKVALARAVSATLSRPIDCVAVLANLRARYPNAYVFAVSRGDSCFLGATPERLVGLRSGLVRASALAGTAPRGATEIEDAYLGQQLLASPKNRHEHALVVDMLRAAIEGLCVDIHAPAKPVLLKLSNVQHLYTPLSGRLRPRTTLLDLLDHLHPTPAVGGLPRTVALDHIRASEQLDRGWYAGPIGWLDARGEGDFAVALRSGLVHANHALVFAGCGIVADSDPEEEYAETCLKLRPMLDALALREAP